MFLSHSQDSVERGAFLRDLRRPEAGPRVPMMLAIALDIARAIEFLHSHGIVHGGARAISRLCRSRKYSWLRWAQIFDLLYQNRTLT